MATARSTSLHNLSREFMATIGESNVNFSGQELFNATSVVVEKTWKDWLLLSLTTGLFLFISLWLSVAMIRAAILLKGEDKLSNTNKRIKIITAASCVLYTTYCLSKILEETVVELVEHRFCAAAKYMAVATGQATLGLTYGALWLRQRALYSEESLAHLITSFYRAISWISCGLSIILPTFYFAMYAGAYTLAVVPSGCAIVNAAFHPQTVWVIAAAASGFIHCTLLWPFIYPLIKYSSERNINGVDLKPVIVRSLVTAAVCAISDMSVYSLNATSVINDGVTIGVAAQCSVFTNLLMIVVAFPDWKITVFPFYKQKERIENAKPNTAGVTKMNETNCKEVDEHPV